MPDYLAPGVYITEVAFDAKPIEGVSTSTAGIIGGIVAETRRLLGPLAPDWTERNDGDAGIALLELLAWLAETLVYRAEQVPERGVLHASRLTAAALALVTDREQAHGSVLKRVRFFEGRLLDADDLCAEVDYVRRRMDRHNREMHRAGIVRGLDVSVNDGGGSQSTIVVTPGYAIDNHGREIVLEEQLALPLPAALSCAFVIARLKRRVPPWIVLEPSAKCEFLVVIKPEGDDSPLARLEKTVDGWRVARTAA